MGTVHAQAFSCGSFGRQLLRASSAALMLALVRTCVSRPTRTILMHSDKTCAASLGGGARAALRWPIMGTFPSYREDTASRRIHMAGAFAKTRNAKSKRRPDFNSAPPR